VVFAVGQVSRKREASIKFELQRNKNLEIHVTDILRINRWLYSIHIERNNIDASLLYISHIIDQGKDDCQFGSVEYCIYLYITSNM
jgi:hypothetical protein